jgi:hypothetical protein
MWSRDVRYMMTQTKKYVTSTSDFFQAKLVSSLLQNLPLLLTAWTQCVLLGPYKATDCAFLNDIQLTHSSVERIAQILSEYVEEAVGNWQLVLHLPLPLDLTCIPEQIVETAENNKQNSCSTSVFLPKPKNHFFFLALHETSKFVPRL